MPPGCQRQEVLKRISALGLKQLYLPTLCTTKPDGPHVPILAPSADVLKARKRVIVLINDDTYQDLGILAYRELQRDGGINGGSIVNFLKELISRDEDDVDVVEELNKDGAGVKGDAQIPGVIVLNTAQLLYSHKFNQALSTRSWTALPRKSITHDAIVMHPVENRVEGHRTPQEHIKSVLDSVIRNPEFVATDAEVYVIAIENGVDSLMDVLNEDCKCRRMSSFASADLMYLSLEVRQPHHCHGSHSLRDAQRSDHQPGAEGFPTHANPAVEGRRQYYDGLHQVHQPTDRLQAPAYVLVAEVYQHGRMA